VSAATAGDALLERRLFLHVKNDVEEKVVAPRGSRVASHVKGHFTRPTRFSSCANAFPESCFAAPTSRDALLI